MSDFVKNDDLSDFDINFIKIDIHAYVFMLEL